MSNPLRTYPSIMQRSPHLVHLYLANQPEVPGYQFWGHSTINDAYGDPPDSGVGGAGPVSLFEVQRGLTFRSERLRRSGRGQIVGSIRGQTHVAFDPDDYNAAGAGGSPIPHDDFWMFLRVQENRPALGLLAQPGVPEATLTLTGVLAGDEITIKGLIFQFQAGANNLAGRTGALGNEFIVGLGAGDNDAAANLTAALNDNGDVAPAVDLVAPVNTHTFATNPGAPSAVVVVQPEDLAAVLQFGDVAQFPITTSNAVRLAWDADATAEGRLVWTADPATPFLGPILMVPPAIFYGSRNPSLTMQGTAPSGTGCANGVVPDVNDNLASAAPRAMHLIFPVRGTEVSIRNISLVDLLVSLGVGQPMRTVAAGQQLALTSGGSGVKEILLACPTGVAGAAFTLHAVSAMEA